MKQTIALTAFLLTATPAFSQTATCRILCEPTLLIEPTITWEKDATVFETIFALDLSTPIPRIGVTLEAITKPFSGENDVELESEVKLYCSNHARPVSKSKARSTMWRRGCPKARPGGRSRWCS